MDTEKIRLLMKEKNITASDMARRLNRHKSVITRFLNGESKNITINLAIGIARVLEVSLDDIIINIGT